VIIVILLIIYEWAEYKASELVASVFTVIGIWWCDRGAGYVEWRLVQGQHADHAASAWQSHSMLTVYLICLSNGNEKLNICIVFRAVAIYN